MSMGGEFVAGGSSAQLMSALTLLADPAKFQQRLDQLKAAEEAAGKVIANAKIAGDVVAALSLAEKARVEAHDLRDKAQVALLQAQAKAQKLNDDAEVVSAKLEADALSYKQGIDELVAKSLAEVAAEKAAIERERSELTAAQLAVFNERQALEETAADLKRFEEALTAEKAQITEAQKRIAAAVDTLKA